MLHSSRGLLRYVCAIGLLLTATLAPTPAFATSAQVDWTEPVPPTDQQTVRGKAMFGIIGGSDLYDTVGNLGASFTIGSVRDGELYFFADMLTWISNPKPTEFKPRRIVYTLEVGNYLPFADKRFSLFVKHQSYHDVDFFDGISESYELYGARFNTSDYTDPGVVLRVGKYLNQRVVDYDWDYAAFGLTNIGTIGDRALYLSAWLHHVTENDSPARDGFTDCALESGVRYKSGVTLFLRYQTLHDVDRFAGVTDHQLILGTKYIW